MSARFLFCFYLPWTVFDCTKFTITITNGLWQIQFVCFTVPGGGPTECCQMAAIWLGDVQTKGP